MKTNKLKKVLLILFIQVTALFYSQAGTVRIDLFSEMYGRYDLCPGDSVNLAIFGQLTGYTSSTESITCIIDFGDGSTQSISRTVNSPDTMTFMNNITHHYTTIGIYTPTLTINVLSDGANSTRNLLNPINVLSTCITLSGTTYNDCNLNCIYDIGEEIQGYSSLYNGLTYYSNIYSDISGHYNVTVPPNTYNLRTYNSICYPSAWITGINSTSTNNIPNNCSIYNVNTNFSYLDSLSHCTEDTIDFHYYINSNNTLYSAGTLVNVEINFGDGTITTLPITLTASGSSAVYNGYISHVFHTNGIYSPIIKYTMPDGNFVINTCNSIEIIGACDLVSGYLYNDANGNCIKDAGELPLVNYPVSINGGGISNYDYTDINGYYSFRVPIGATYDLNISSYYTCPSGVIPSCPSSGSVSFTLSGLHFQDFAFVNTTTFDASVYFYNITPRSYIRTDENSSGRIGYRVNSVSPISGSVSMTLDPLTVFVSSIPSPSSISGSVVTWNYSGLSLADGIQYIDVTFHTSPLADTFNPMDSTGDIICLDFDITPTIADCYTYNNHEHLCIPVGGSWDPNHKEVSPQGAGPEGIIAPGTDLTYTVHFQNMGTSFARNVFVMDTLDPDLDMNTFQLISNSHPVQVHWLEGNILKFAFDNIMLVDTSVSQDSSQGYVQYRIKHNATAPLGTEISNTASIYFDYNPAVVTNTTHNKLGEPNSVPYRNNESSTVKIYPNPAQDYVMIETDGKELTTIEVYNMLGKLVETKAITNQLEKLNIEKYNNGVYLINALNKTGQIVETKKLNVIK